MSFLTLKFSLFLSVAVLVFHELPPRMRSRFLLAVSCLFYMSWSVPYAFLIGGIAVAAYASALEIEDRPGAGKRTFWMTGVAILLMVFLFFKILPFLPSGGPSTLLMPLGLSYVTLKLIGYLTDVHRQGIKAERSFVSLANYAAFFPQIPCGPIQRAADFLPQLAEVGRVRQETLLSGLRLILFGLFKKMVVADAIGSHVDVMYSQLGIEVGARYFLCVYAYAFQLYADFSGITDMAVGIGRLFGIKAPDNFNRPFYSPNILEFWRRWHITLTSWFSDYLLVPMKSRLTGLGTPGLCLSIFVTMTAMGLWHGFHWNFLIFGALQGIFMVVSILTLSARDRLFIRAPLLNKCRKFIGTVITFHLVALSLVFIRVGTVSEAWTVIQNYLFSIHTLSDIRSLDDAMWLVFDYGFGLGRIPFLTLCTAVFVMEIGHWVRTSESRRRQFFSMPRWLQWCAYYSLILMIFLMGDSGATRFIYDRF